MGPGMIFWILVILGLVIIYVIHLRKCYKHFQAKRQQQLCKRRAAGSTEVQSPFTISSSSLQDDIEQGFHIQESVGYQTRCQPSLPKTHSYRRTERSVTFNFQHLEEHDKKDLPTYDEVIAQDLQNKCLGKDSNEKNRT